MAADNNNGLNLLAQAISESNNDSSIRRVSSDDNSTCDLSDNSSGFDGNFGNDALEGEAVIDPNSAMLSPPSTPPQIEVCSCPDLSPPLALYDPESHVEFVDGDSLLDIISTIDLKSSKSIQREIPLPPDRLNKSRHPKPPNHVICQESWKQCINSMSAFMLLPLEEQKREVEKAKLYSSKDARLYRSMKDSLMKAENRNLNYRYKAGTRTRSRSVRVNLQNTAVGANTTNSLSARPNSHNAAEEANALHNPDPNPESVSTTNHIGLASSAEERDALIEDYNGSSGSNKRRKRGSAPQTVAAQSDAVAEAEAHRAFLSVARAIDCTDYLGRSANDLTNDFLLIQMNRVTTSNPAGGRHSTACAAEQSTLRVLTSSNSAARRCLEAFRKVHSRNPVPHNILSELIEREDGRTMVSTVEASNKKSSQYRRAAPRRHLTISEVHGNVTPTHPSYISNHARTPDTV